MTEEMHGHYRRALIAGVVFVAATGAVVFVAVAPVVAAAAGVAGGSVLVYAGGHWARRKLGLPGSGRKWRPPRPRPARTGGAGVRRPAAFGRSAGRGARAGGGVRLPRLGGRSGGGRGGARLPGLQRRGSSSRRSAAPGAGAARIGRGRSTGRGRTGLPRSAATAPGGSGGRRRRLGAGSGRRSAASAGAASRGRGLPGRTRPPGIMRGRSRPAGTMPGRKRTASSVRGGGRPIGTGKARGRGRFRPSLPSLPGLPKLGGGRGRKTAARKSVKAAKSAKAARSRGPSSVMGARRVKSGPRKGQWQRYRKPTKRQQARPRARHAGEYAVVPFAVAWAGGRWMLRKARRKPPPPPPKLTVHRPVRAPAARGPAAPVPAAKPAPAAQPQRPKPRLYDSERGPTIMHHVSAASEAVTQHLSSWEPENAKDLDNFLAALPELFGAIGGSLRSVAGRLDGLPIHPSVIDRLHDIAATVTGMSDFSGEAHAVHRAQHEKEMERIENPRPREDFWDVSRQD